MKFLKPDNPNGVIDMTHTMYPSSLEKITGVREFIVPEYSTVYGVVLEGKVSFDSGKKILNSLEYFCLTEGTAQVEGSAVFFTRHGFKGQTVYGGPIEDSGRLCYIDNCSDTILVYPPRFGDPSISLLSFPEMITQRFHTHPSIRLGVIIRGQGASETPDGTVDLVPGTAFCVQEREVHRFITTSSSLDAVSFHPDGEWGPTDENHTLLNRTYGGKFMTENNE